MPGAHTHTHIVSDVCLGLQVRLASWAPPVLQVKVSKETKGTKGQQVGQDRLVARETLVFQA